MEVGGTIGGFGVSQGGGQRFMLPTESAISFMRASFLKQLDLMQNEFGVYSFQKAGADGKAKIAKLNTPHSLFQARTNCATWTPKGELAFGREEIDTYPIEFNGTQCWDSLVGDCFEQVFGPGNQLTDITATAEGRALYAMMMEAIYDGLGNSFFDLTAYGGYSVITSSNSGSWWDNTSMTASEWADFVDQNTGITGLSGHITLMEALKAAGNLSHFDVTIASGDVSGGTWTGGSNNITVLFEAILNAATSKFKTYLRKNRLPISQRPVMLVTPSLYKGYKDYLIATYSAIPEGYYLRVDGEIQRGVLLYDGLPVVSMDEWLHFDERVGVNTHRAVLTMPGNLVVAHRVDSLSQFGGMGLIMERSPNLRDKGRIDMYTTLRAGAAIADTDFMVHASRVITP